MGDRSAESASCRAKSIRGFPIQSVLLSLGLIRGPFGECFGDPLENVSLHYTMAHDQVLVADF